VNREDYTNYAELLFQRFGDRVKFWITLNQPFSLAPKAMEMDLIHQDGAPAVNLEEILELNLIQLHITNF